MTARRSFLAIAGAAMVGGAVPCPTRAAHPDADLIRICAEHIENRAAVNADERDADDDNPLWLAYLDTFDAIGAAKPKTVAGLLAMARAAKAEAQRPDGGEDPDHGPSARWAWDIVNGLLGGIGGVA